MDSTNRRLSALLILGVVALLSPLLGALNRPVTVFGFPLLPAYCFACWAALVAAAALSTRGGGR